MIWAKYLLPQASKSCPKCKKSPNLVTLDVKMREHRAQIIKESRTQWFSATIQGCQLSPEQGTKIMFFGQILNLLMLHILKKILGFF